MNTHTFRRKSRVNKNIAIKLQLKGNSSSVWLQLEEEKMKIRLESFLKPGKALDNKN